MAKRTNDQWLTELAQPGSARELALADLRQLLLSGLKRGLLGQINTNAPEFDTQAEDFVQESTLKILDKLDTFAGRSQFTTWAHKIAVSVALTELRRKRWQDNSLDGMLTTDKGDYTPSFIADNAPQPEKATEQAEMLAHVQRIIDETLTDKQRLVLETAVIQGKSTNEVAEIMDMKPNAVYKLLHDARLRLKNELESDGLTTADVLSVFE
ncbi:MAG: sigma-70 family RNA polymerase sigma factor [Anaerolineae bacterium]|nr:sigma-70 family RNA polymerase sigma factor [Anaerolineae bacterium]